MSIYTTEVIYLGRSVDKFKKQNKMIFYSSNIPDRIKQNVYYTKHSEISEDIKVGGVVIFDSDSSVFKITAVGSDVANNISKNGYIRMLFDDATEALQSDSLHLECKQLPICRISTEISIFNPDPDVASSTTVLLEQRLQNEGSYTVFMKSHEHKIRISKLPNYLKEMIFQTGKRPGDLFKDTTFTSSYVYQMLNGKRIPSRDKLILFAFCTNMSLDQLNFALKLAEKSPLYVRNPRDSIIMHGLVHKKSIDEVNESLVKYDFLDIN